MGTSTPAAPLGGYDTLIVGGGVIGLATAWRAAQRGLAVAVIDPEPGSGASYASAGMLAPVSEVTHGEEELLRLNLAALHAYPDFVAELENAAGLDAGYAGYRDEGTVQVALDADDLAVLDDVQRFQEELGIQPQRLSRRECRRHEPMLAPAVRGGLLASGDHSVDPRQLTRALLAAAQQRGVTLLRDSARQLLVEHDRAVGVVLAEGGELRAAQVMLAAGCWTPELEGVPPRVLPPVRPVKGQILRLRTELPFITRTVRGLVHGSRVYLVPRTHGEIVMGATQEELGYDTTVTAGGVWELLRDARELLPGVTELELVEARAGLRPGSPDNAPFLGPTALPGLLVASGHYRNGMLLTPVTADVMAQALATGQVPETAAAFSPRRYEGAFA